MIPEVTLTAAECLQAAMVGVTRQITNLRDGRQDAYGAQKDLGWQLHLEGACGEMAFAKYAGIYWSGALGNLSADDVGEFQIRTATRPTDSLILHPKDPDDRIFVLLIGTAPTYQLRGWIHARDGKNTRYWRDPLGNRAAFFVPQSALKPMRQLFSGRAPGDCTLMQSRSVS